MLICFYSIKVALSVKRNATVAHGVLWLFEHKVMDKF